MCQSKEQGGKRCYSNLDAAFAKADAAFRKAIESHDFDLITEANERRTHLQLEKDRTAKGKKFLLSEIERTGDPDGLLANRLLIAEATNRQLESIASSEVKTAQGNDSFAYTQGTKETFQHLKATRGLPEGKRNDLIKEQEKVKGSPLHMMTYKIFNKKYAGSGKEFDINLLLNVVSGEKSAAGYAMEDSFEFVANKDKTGKAGEHQFNRYVKGSTIQKELEVIRHTKDPLERNRQINDITNKYHMNPIAARRFFEHLDSNDKKKAVSVSIPDGVSFFEHPVTKEKTVRISEHKISGENDNKSTHINTARLLKSDLWNDVPGVKVERAIVLNATNDKGKKGNEYPMENRWKKSIDLQKGNALVLSNEKAFEWSTGKTVSRDYYRSNVILPVSEFMAERLSFLSETPKK